MSRFIQFPGRLSRIELDNMTKKHKSKKKPEKSSMGYAPSIQIDEEDEAPKTKKISKDDYFMALGKLQIELVKLQEWVKARGLKVVVLFEGRDAAGKGGSIKRITEPLNPRICRVIALPAPTEREKTQWYFQRYIEHLPAAGEIVLLDRSWYNRAGVERVMSFCGPNEYLEFMRQTPEFERMLVRSGIRLYKYWFSVTQTEQKRRFKAVSYTHLTLPTTRQRCRSRWSPYH